MKVILASFGVTSSQRYGILQNRKEKAERNVQAVGVLPVCPAP